MKNKKSHKIIGISFFVFAGILFIFLILYLIFHTIPYLSKPQFIIYQNECRNETSSYDGCVLGCGTGIIGSTKEYSVDEAILLCEKVCSKLIKQVCEQKEVRGITFPFDCLRNNKRECGIFLEKKDITTSWLDENCVPIETTCNEYGKDCGKFKFSKYFCGDYTVEVKNGRR